MGDESPRSRLLKLLLRKADGLAWFVKEENRVLKEENRVLKEENRVLHDELEDLRKSHVASRTRLKKWIGKRLAKQDFV